MAGIARDERIMCDVIMVQRAGPDEVALRVRIVHFQWERNGDLGVGK